MQRSEAWDAVRSTAQRVLEVDPAALRDETSFVDDLAVDSLALVEYAMVLEDELHLTLTEDETSTLKTVGALVDLLVDKTQDRP